jgi:hypothetical protein
MHNTVADRQFRVGIIGPSSPLQLPSRLFNVANVAVTLTPITAVVAEVLNVVCAAFEPLFHFSPVSRIPEGVSAGHPVVRVLFYLIK